MKVKCTFQDLANPRHFSLFPVHAETIYTCQIENQVIQEDKELKFVGQHLNNKTNNDVKVISFKLCTITKVPNDLLKYFPNLHSLEIYASDLKVINKDDLFNYKHFRSLNFDSNQIEFLPGDLLEGFVNLEKVSFNNNNLRVIEPTILDGLPLLSSVNLSSNLCYDCHWLEYRNRIYLPEIKKKLNEAYFARFKFLSDMKLENEELKNLELQKNRETTALPKSLGIDESTRSNSNIPKYSCFCSEIKEVLKDENNFKDFTIMIENEEIQVNKLLLAARSPVLAKILQDNPNTDSFNLVDISVETFKEILKYLYTDKLGFNEISNSMHLFAAAHRLKIIKLKDIAAMDISSKITTENVIEILSLSNRFEHDKLRQNAFNEVKKNYPKIEFKDEWAKQPEKVLRIVEAFKAKEEKMRRIEAMVQNMEHEFQTLLT